MSKSRAIKFTDEDLGTLVWALSSQYHRVFLRNLKAGNPGEDKTTAHLASLIKVTYGELIRRQSNEPDR